MIKYYIDPLIALGVDQDELVAFSLDYNAQNKAPAKLVKSYVEVLLRSLDSLGTEILYCADATYFKALTGMKKADPHHGYQLNCSWEGYKHIKVVLGVNYSSLFHNPANEPKLVRSLDTLASVALSYYREPGKDIINTAHYPREVSDIANFLQSLHIHPELTADFETFGLRHYNCGIASVGFAWNDESGGAFLVDYHPLEIQLPVWNDRYVQVGSYFGRQVANREVRALLRKFFEDYKGKIIWHNISFDATIAVSTLWMNGILDRPNVVKGVDTMFKNFGCTKLISYLATNSCTGNDLSLKEQSQAFAGNYAQEEIKDVGRISPDQLLEYNLVDCLSTWYTYNKNYPIMVADDQEEIYEGLFKDSTITNVEMQLTGLPIDMARVKEVKKILSDISYTAHGDLMAVPALQSFIHKTIQEKIAIDNEMLKTKKRTYAEAKEKCIFNPSSPKQLQSLFYDFMGLPILDKTKTKQPSTGAGTIKKLLNHTKNKEFLTILNSIMDFSKVEKILNTFIPAFEQAQDGGDGRYYLFGNYNLGGTVSGRLSSSGPNMQNLPASGWIGKLIKSCFSAPDGWLFGGADFASLEDYVSALTTRDPNKLKVYEQGFDGHNLRAYSYFKEQMPDIQKKIECIGTGQRFFQLINDNGEVEYVSESELNDRGIEIPVKV